MSAAGTPSEGPTRGGKGAGGREPVVLYRCPTPTNVLCPCGAVARRLARLGIEHRTERVPYRRAARPEIEELTSQRRVPVLVDGDEVIHDSKRILQYLDRAYEGPDRPAEERALKGRGPGVYNVRRWRLRRRQSS